MVEEVKKEVPTEEPIEEETGAKRRTRRET